MKKAYKKLTKKAIKVLDGNWAGKYTKPSPRLYPHQWSWDSGFIAMAYAHFDQDRAQQEMLSLFDGQWSNGLLPQIVYHKDEGEYFPDPPFWNTNRSPHSHQFPLTSGIVQPPIHATAVLKIHEKSKDQAESLGFLREIFPNLAAWHSYLHSERDPYDEGLVSIVHPWESGQDNSPLWDSVLQRMIFSPDEIPSYSRKDTLFVDSKERPEKPDYDRYVYLVKFLYDRNYDMKLVFEDSPPFAVQDVLFNTLLVQANLDLAAIAKAVGEDPSPFIARAGNTTLAMNNKLWDDDHGIYTAYDVAGGALLHSHVGAGFTPLFAGVPTNARASRLVNYLDSRAFCPIRDNCYAVPSFDITEKGFSPNRYWRGPVWININWLLYHGLLRYGFRENADWVRRAIVELPSMFGFREYYDPHEGRGYGSDNFSWTAALAFDVLCGEAQACGKDKG